MATPKTIVSTIGFTDPSGALVASGHLTFTLSQAAEVASGGGLVDTAPISVNLTALAVIPASFTLWAADQLNPTGTTYRLKLTDSNNNLVGDFGQVSLVGGSPIDISQLIPVSSSGGTVSYPAPVLLNPGVNQKILTGNLEIANNETVDGTLTVVGASTLATGSFGGAWTKGTASSPYILQLKDPGGLNNQLIGFNIEQEANPTSSANYINFAQASELFTPTTNSQTFPSQSVGVYGSVSHFGSGAIGTIVGGNFEGFNPGPATATVISGVTATANNGGVATGSPVQTPTNNGVATNLRGVDAIAKNLSSGVVTEATAYYAEAPLNTGGGTITNAYGLHVADMSAATNNFAILTGQGKVSIGDQTTFNGLIGQGVAPDAGRGMFITPTSVTGLAGTTQLGIQSAPTTSSASTVGGEGVRARCDTANAAFVQALNVNFRADTPTKGAASTITEWNGLRVEAGPTAGTKWAIKVVGTEAVTGITLPAASSTNNVTKLNFQNNLAPVTGNAADQTFFTYTIPANVVPTGGGVKITAIWKHSTGTANITYKASLGGTVTSNYGAVVDAASSVYSLSFIYFNIGTTVAKADQYFTSNAGTMIASGVSYATALALNLTSNQAVALTFNVAATDQVTPQMFLVELIQ